MRARLLVLLVLLVLVACKGSSPPSIPKIAQTWNLQDDGFHAGLARADITPPLHLAMFGHGPEGRIATGMRLRLRCSAFVIAQGKEHVAIVPCDLPAPSLALHRSIADKLAAQGSPITGDRLLLMATHTHAGPAHYFEARRYSGSFSTYAPGYDPKVVDYLATRIAQAIFSASAAMRPACIAWRKDKLEGITFNRAYGAFVKNEGAITHDVWKTIDQARQNEQNTLKLASGPSGPEGAVDTEIDVLRIDARMAGDMACKATKPLGAFAVFGVHNTAIANTNELYHGDVFGFASRMAESCLTDDQATCESKPPSDGDPIVGIANGIEGDVSPKVTYQSVAEARRVGRVLGRKIVELFADKRSCFPLAATGTLARAYWELSWPNGVAAVDDETNAPVRLCSQGEIGVAAAGGARDGPTRMRIFPEANPGYRLPSPEGCHGRKLPLVGGFDTDPRYDFPHVGPITIVRLGRGVLVTAPGEMTTTTGQGIRDVIRRRLHVDAQNEMLRAACEAGDQEPVDPKKFRPLLQGGIPYSAIPVVGLTNSYLQYFASSAEYDVQLYEGASTLYGPRTASFLTRHFDCLAAHMTGEPEECANEGQTPIDTLAAIDRSPSPEVSRLADDDPDFHPKRLAPLRVSAAATDAEGQKVWEVVMEGLPPALFGDRKRFSVEMKSKDTLIDDDRGSSIEVAELQQGSLWRIRWVPLLTRAHPACDTKVRFVIGGRIRLESNEFTVDCGDLP